ncbi:uncharacterized protein LOC113589458 [Electrophorus electricus]|uniref:uncharacterized protein LOC113589458 n=1 Tax=Electrophorus electricus TaxID=8005 RepID=UPI000F0A7542|nr:uncharacterized protein LOC113589458 [Electrophorus electricus]
MITSTCWKILALCAGVCTVHFSTATDETMIIKSDCNQNITLPCNPAAYSHAYTSITWYKVNGSGDEGIIRRRHGNLEPELYPSSRNVASLTEKNDLVLKNVTVRQTGLYKCSLIAKVGKTNNHSLVMLNVSECASVTAPALLLAAVLAPQATEMQCTGMGHIKPEEVTALWAFVGFSTVGMIKVLLCAVYLWVVVVFKKHRRRKMWD